MSGPVVAPTREDPVVATVSESIGGPLGRLAWGRRRWFAAAGVLALLASVMLAIGMVQKQPCYSRTWTDGDVNYSYMCYSDMPFLYTARGFAELEWPYSNDAAVRSRYEVMEYPVGISYWAWGAAYVTHWLAGSPDLGVRAQTAPDRLFDLPGLPRETRIFVTVNAVGLAAVGVLAVWLLAGANRGRPWDAAAFALSPALALSSLVNWDLLAVVFVAAALWAWARGRPVLTGVMIGLGTATKLYPLFLLGGLLIICIRRRRWGDLALASVAAAVAWGIANLPAWVTGPSEWKVFWSFNAERGPDLGSIWMVISQAADVAISAHTVNVVSWVFFGVWCVGVLVLGLSAPQAPRLAQLGFLVVTGFLLINKVYSPQYVLWLLPLAVLARPRWRDLLVWQAGEVLYFCFVWWYLGGQLDAGGGGDVPFYWFAIVLRILAQLYLVVVVVRDIMQPWHDPVVESDEWIVPEPVRRVVSF